MKFLIFLGAIASAFAANFEIINQRGDTVWIGIQGGGGQETLEQGGFVLDAGQSRNVDAPDNWEGRIWARTGCDPNTNHCETGDCGNVLECNGAGGVPPVTLVEIKFAGSGDQDFYDVSLVDGYNVMARIEPVDGSGECPPRDCSGDINAQCYDDLKVFGADGNTVACKSACTAYGTPETCCPAPEYTVDNCRPDTWPVNTAQLFKDICPNAYSYAYDDQTSLRTCSASTYRVTFF